MIVAYISDPYLRAALRQAAHPEEDVVVDSPRALEAVEHGFPRLVVYTSDQGSRGPLVGLRDDIPTLALTRAMLAGWEADRKRQEVPASRIESVTGRLAALVERRASEQSWVDRTLAELSRYAGTPLPLELRALARRVLEFPSHYTDLQPLAEACGVSTGALKQRFRRRDLPSPSAYLRWFRMMAVAHVLSDREVTVARASRRLGFTSDGNLCRAMMGLTGQTPTEVRTTQGRNRLLSDFAGEYLTREILSRWEAVDGFLVHRVA